MTSEVQLRPSAGEHSVPDHSVGGEHRQQQRHINGLGGGAGLGWAGLAGWETHTPGHRRHINGLGGGAGLGLAGWVVCGGRLVVSGGWWVVGGRLGGWWEVGWW